MEIIKNQIAIFADGTNFYVQWITRSGKHIPIFDKSATTVAARQSIKEKTRTSARTSIVVDALGNPVKCSISDADQLDIDDLTKEWGGLGYFGTQFRTGFESKEAGEAIYEKTQIKVSKVGVRVVGAIMTSTDEFKAPRHLRKPDGKTPLVVAYLETSPLVRDSKEFKGIGTAMILDTIKESKKMGKNGEVILYSVGNALPFYRKLGFKHEDPLNPADSGSWHRLDTVAAEKLLNAFGD